MISIASNLERAASDRPQFTVLEASPAESPAVSQASRDSGLIRLFLDGDESAFVKIMTFYRPRLFNLAYRYLRNHGDAEEIVQDTFMRAHRNLANFRGDSSLATWLYRITLNLSRNRYCYFSRRHRGSSLSLDSAVGDSDGITFGDIISHNAPDPAQESSRQDISQVIVSCMDKLDGRHSEILKQRIFRDLSYDEIGVSLGLKPGTVKSRLARARNCLRRVVIEACPEFGENPKSSAWFAPYREQPGYRGPPVRGAA